MSAAELIMSTGSTPTAPASGRITLYAGTDDRLYYRDAAGNTHLLLVPGAAQTFTDTQTFNGTVTLGGSGAQVAFYGAVPVSKPTVSGSRGGNAALESLLTALASLGLIVNNTTA